MKITEFAIKRPSAMTMMIMFFVVLGLFSYAKIGSDLFPKADVPYVTIITTYPGAGAEEVENQVVDDIEEAVSSLSGLKGVRSWIAEGLATTVLEFSMGTNVDIAAMDTQKAVDRVMLKLPKDVEKPVIQKVDMNSEALLTLAVSGDRPMDQIYDITKERVKGRLETVAGVGSVQLIGGMARQVKVEIDRDRLKSYGLSVNQLVQLLKAENLNAPIGNIKDTSIQYDVRMVGKFKTLDDIANLPIIVPPGKSIHLGDVAKVTDTFAEAAQYSRLDRQDAVALIIQKQSGASIEKTAQGLRDELEKIKGSLPNDVKIITVDDTSVFIRDALNDTQRTLFEGVIMTGLVLLLFLRNWRSLVIVMLAIPTSIIATFMMIYFFGFTFNMLSLMGLSLCVGILVDDSIVVLENIHRHMKMGKNPIRAAIDGRTEIGMAAVAITLSDVVVFAPIAFMEGMVGQFFREFGLTVVVATLFSLFISFTMTPMMAARLFNNEELRVIKKKKRRWDWAARLADSIGDRVLAFYRVTLLWAMKNRLKVLVAIVTAIVLSVALIPSIGFEFISKADQSKFKVMVEMAPGTTLAATDSVVTKLEDRLSQIPEVSSVFATVGSSTGTVVSRNSSNMATLAVILKPKSERLKSVWEVANEVREWTKDYPEANLKIIEAQMAGFNYMEAPIMVEVRGADMDTLVELAKKVNAIVENTPGTTDVSMSWKADSQPEYHVVIDRDKTSAAGLTAAEIAMVMRTALVGDTASIVKLGGKDVDIWVQLDEAYRNTPEDIGNIAVTNRFGQAFSIKDLADITEAKGPSEIRHKNRSRMITIIGNYKEASLSSVRQSFDSEFAKLNIPDGYEIGYDGEIKQMDEANVDLAQALLLSLVLVYMILVVLYESFLTPFIRMLSLPCGVIGAMLALYLTGSTLNMLSIIGIIMLDGLAAKNGTLLIDYTNTLMRGGMTLREALLEAGTKRLRPIFMTSLTMIFGMLPTAMALAEGSEIRRSMGVVLVGGLITSTVLTPILIPLAYTLLDDFKTKVSGVLVRGKGEKPVNL